MTRTCLAAMGLGLLVFGGVACGGEPPPPKQPETTPVAPEPAATPAPTAEAPPAATTAAPEPPPPPPPPPELAKPSASAKAKVNTGKALDLEIKSDGTVTNAGKPAGKVTGMEFQDKDGKTQLKVDADGTITTGDGAPYAKFEGDTLALATNVKYEIGDDGALQQTPEKGAPKSLGKTDGVGSAKRAVLLAVAFSTWGTKAPQPKAGAGPKPIGGQPAEKTTGEKPAGDKKPTPKK